eukprot:1381602-Pyramimonas_sp.AAC.1
MAHGELHGEAPNVENVATIAKHSANAKTASRTAAPNGETKLRGKPSRTCQTPYSPPSSICQPVSAPLLVRARLQFPQPIESITELAP